MLAPFHKELLSWNFFRISLICLVACQLICGCVLDGKSKKKANYKIGLVTESKVDSIRLFTSPTLLNLDKVQGVDGFLAKLYAIQNGTPKPIEIKDGIIEFALYEEVVEGSPLQVWRYEADALMSQMSNSSIGVVYEFQIIWSLNNKPKKKAAVLARYIAPDGREIRALPVVLSLEP